MMRHTPPGDFEVAEGWAAPPSNSLVRFLPFVAALYAATLFVIDTFVVIDIAIAVLYVAVVLMSLTFCGRRGVIAVGATCMMLTILAFALQHSDEPIGDSSARCVVSLLAITMTTILSVWIQSTTAAIRNQAK